MFKNVQNRSKNKVLGDRNCILNFLWIFIKNVKKIFKKELEIQLGIKQTNF